MNAPEMVVEHEINQSRATHTQADNAQGGRDSSLYGSSSNGREVGIVYAERKENVDDCSC